MSGRAPGNNHHVQEHGSVGSYVSGFILSVIFTLIPYYLVVNQKVTGTPLLVTILVFAFIQMIIQVTFFLHLGRGRKPNWNLFFFVSTFGIVLMVVAGSMLIINNLHYNMSPSDQTKRLVNDEGIAQIGGTKTGACYGQYQNHRVIIKDGQVSPSYTKAKQCDTLTFTNQDGQLREIAFGEHPAHEVYAGVSEVPLPRGKSETITLSETGSYDFRDHLHEATSGIFIVGQ